MSYAKTRKRQRQLDVLCDVSRALMEHNIAHATWSGMHAAFMCGYHREPDDIDILVADADIFRVPDIFPDAHVYVGEDRVIVNLKRGDINVELMAYMDVHTPVGVFPLRLTETIRAGISYVYIRETKVPFAPTEATILLKAILSRGAEVGKHDIVDMRALCQNQLVDTARLLCLTKETQAHVRVAPVFRMLQMI